MLETFGCSLGEPPERLRSLWELCWLSLLWVRPRLTDPEMVRFPPGVDAPRLAMLLAHSDGGLLREAGESTRRPTRPPPPPVLPQLIFDFTSLKFFLTTDLFSAILLITASHLLGVADFFIKLRLPTLPPPTPPRGPP
uniref:(northern house mosquito) hypothetical protein n=1 Tax=Culex pipiens TaxID=7175 RepID=A0A8D8I6X3_CULPI